MEPKNMMRNIVPSIAVMAIGLVGAYFVYNVYFSDKTATTAAQIATFEPASGDDVAVTEGVATEETATEDATVEGVTETMEGTAETAVEGAATDAVEFVSGEVVESGEAAVEGAADAVEGEVAPESTEAAE